MWCVAAFPGDGQLDHHDGSRASPCRPTSGPPRRTGRDPASGQAPIGLGTDPALDALALTCYNGDMAACDTLFDSAPLGSPYQVYGDTCAARQLAGTFKYCQESFPAAAEP